MKRQLPRGVLPEGGFASTPDGAFAEGAFDARRKKAASDEVQSQITGRYVYACSHPTPFWSAYVKGFRSVKD